MLHSDIDWTIPVELKVTCLRLLPFLTSSGAISLEWRPFQAYFTGNLFRYGCHSYAAPQLLSSFLQLSLFFLLLSHAGSLAANKPITARIEWGGLYVAVTLSI
jgi:hypothetical protein